MFSYLILVLEMELSGEAVNAEEFFKIQSFINHKVSLLAAEI